MSALFRRLSWTVVCVIAFMPSCWPAPPGSTKLAIVDVGMGARVPPGFMDFLVAQLSREPQVALLERGQVEWVLRE